jgi:teichuronic acid biosynthesis glycosyltransferase TuaH
MKTFDHDIVMLALPRWDGPYASTAYSLARALSQHTRVFYIDNPFTVKDYFKKKDTDQVVRRKNALLHGEDIFMMPDVQYPNLIAVTPRLVLPVNWLSQGFIYDKLSQLNDSIVSAAMNKILKIFAIRKYVFINSFNPLYGKYFSLDVKPALTVYQSVDDISQAPYMEKHGTRLENEAVKKADFTIVTSSELKKLKSAHSSKVFLLPNAAQVALFQRAVKEDLRMPAEIKKIPADKKIICYTGNICQRLDYELIVKTAKAHSDKIILMIGPFARNTYLDFGLDKIPNIIFAGKKKIEELPAYLKYSDCAIIPFLCNQLTKSIYPLKINEYLSAGRPVVTTNFSEDILNFREVAEVSESHQDFINLIDKVIYHDSEDKEKARVAFSSANNWEARAHHFIDLTVEFLKHNDRGRGKSERRNRVQAIYE